MIASCSCCRFVGCTSMMWISCFTTSQRCSIGLRSGDCGGHLSKVNSLSNMFKKPVWDDLSFVTWCIILQEVASEDTRQGRMDPCFHVLYVKFWPYHLNVAAEIETHQIRQRFSNLLLSNSGKPVWIVVSVSCSYLTGAAPGVVFCCCSSSASGFDVLCVQRWYSAYLGCNEWLFELLLPFYHL